jgi:hypothetical protein
MRLCAVPWRPRVNFRSKPMKHPARSERFFSIDQGSARPAGDAASVLTLTKIAWARKSASERLFHEASRTATGCRSRAALSIPQPSMIASRDALRLASLFVATCTCKCPSLSS